MLSKAPPHIEVRNLTMAYGDRIIQKDVNFTIDRGQVFVIMGGSGCGKSTLLRHMIGLNLPAQGEVLYSGEDFWSASPTRQMNMIKLFGVLYQGGALWSSMTLGENIALPLQQYTDLTEETIREIVSFKLSLVGLAGFESYLPAELSGGMQKRAGLARAMALDPEILFFDEPSAGLDPISAAHLDDLILELCDELGTTVVVVTHELASIFKIADNAIFLDAESKTAIAQGNPNTLLAESQDPRVQHFLRRGETDVTLETVKTGDPHG